MLSLTMLLAACGGAVNEPVETPETVPPVGRPENPDDGADAPDDNDAPSGGNGGNTGSTGGNGGSAGDTGGSGGPGNNPTSPSEPDVPVVKQDILVKSTSNSLTVRSGPGTNYAALGYLDKNDMAAYLGKTGGWYKVTFKRTAGYVSASYATTVAFDTASDLVEKVIDEGKKLLGLPYVLGAQRYHWGNGIKNTNFTGDSFDCSSLTQYIYKVAAGVNLGVTTRDQYVQGTYVSRNNIRRGDLMFFTNDIRYDNVGAERIGHVAMYLGDNYILHTASDHAVIEPISAKRWSHYVVTRRFV